MTHDIFDKRKERIETEMINQAEDRAIPAMLGKAAWEAAKKYTQECGSFPDRKLFSYSWAEVHPDLQVAWVKGAQAAVKEARRVGWI